MKENAGVIALILMEITILEFDVSDDVFIDIDDLHDWLISRGKKYGAGIHYDYYITDEEETIEIKFNVKFKDNEKN